MRGLNLGLLNIGGGVAAVTACDRIFARFGEDLKLVREAAANGAGVSLDGTELQPHAREDPPVGIEHVLVLPAAVFDVRMKAVGVLHDEFAPAHESEARPHLVAKFGLDLIQIERQLAVRAHDAAHEIGDDLFVRGTETEIALVAVFEAKELLAVNLPTAALLP